MSLQDQLSVESQDSFEKTEKNINPEHTQTNNNMVTMTQEEK